MLLSLSTVVPSVPAKPLSIRWMIKFHFNLPEKYESIKLCQIELFYGDFVP